MKLEPGECFFGGGNGGLISRASSFEELLLGGSRHVDVLGGAGTNGCAGGSSTTTVTDFELHHFFPEHSRTLEQFGRDVGNGSVLFDKAAEQEPFVSVGGSSRMMLLEPHNAVMFNDSGGNSQLSPSAHFAGDELDGHGLSYLMLDGPSSNTLGYNNRHLAAGGCEGGLFETGAESPDSGFSASSGSTTVYHQQRQNPLVALKSVHSSGSSNNLFGYPQQQTSQQIQRPIAMHGPVSPIDSTKDIVGFNHHSSQGYVIIGGGGQPEGPATKVMDAVPTVGGGLFALRRHLPVLRSSRHSSPAVEVKQPDISINEHQKRQSQQAQPALMQNRNGNSRAGIGAAAVLKRILPKSQQHQQLVTALKLDIKDEGALSGKQSAIVHTSTPGRRGRRKRSSTSAQSTHSRGGGTASKRRRRTTIKGGDGEPLLLNDEERALCVQEGIMLPTSFPLTKAQEQQLREVRRRIRNKHSAQHSRRRKQDYIESLEAELGVVSAENGDLRRQLQALSAENRHLANELRRIQNSFVRSQRHRTQAATCLAVMLLSVCMLVSPATGNNVNLSARRQLQMRLQQQQKLLALDSSALNKKEEGFPTLAGITISPGQRAGAKFDAVEALGAGWNNAREPVLDFELESVDANGANMFLYDRSNKFVASASSLVGDMDLFAALNDDQLISMALGADCAAPLVTASSSSSASLSTGLSVSPSEQFLLDRYVHSAEEDEVGLGSFDPLDFFDAPNQSLFDGLLEEENKEADF